MIIDFTSGTAEIGQSEYVGLQNGFFFPSGEGEISIINPSCVFIAHAETLAFIAQAEVNTFIAQGS
jgi:hypothetical protein